MGYKVLKAFPLSRDGFRVEDVPVGATPDIPDALVNGLAQAGFIEEAKDEPVEPTIPDGWRELHHTKIIALAKALGADVATKDAAVAAIEAHLVGDTDDTTIPENWRDLDDDTIIALAQRLGAEAPTATAAMDAIAAHQQASQA